MEQKLNILITGASRGIGAAITNKIYYRSDKLFITSKQKTNLEKIKLELSEKKSKDIYDFCLDQKKAIESATKLSEYIKEHTNHLDAVILCAGDYTEGTLSDVDFDSFLNTLNTNLIFNIFLIKNLLPILKKGNSPTIVIIGSTAAFSSYEVPTYSVAKWGLRGYAVNLRKELMKDNIAVTFLSPGGTKTDMWSGVDLPKNRLLSPTDIASLVDCLFDLSPQAVVEEIIIRPMLGDVED